MTAWILKLISGWIPISGDKPLREWFGKIIWVVGIVFVCLIIWNKFTKPTKDITIGSGGTYVESTEGYGPRFGCASGRQFLGWAGMNQK